MSSKLERLKFDDRFLRELPADPEIGARRRQVLGACYSRVAPTPVRAPRLVAASASAAALIGLSPEDLASSTFVEVFAGNRLLPGMEPFAACYGGHQFGVWAGQLGDGRAITLGEAIADSGEHWELQLKGAGLTPYSRTADGRAVLRSSVREFLCSEAMFHLGVPTTRALSLIETGEQVVRDMFYDGNPRPEPGAIVCRMAPSFLRFGNYEIFASRNDQGTLERLARHTVEHHFPELGPPGPAAYAAWFDEVCRRTALLMAHWMRVGFVHGVMNTDNLSILGLTIDYGPYGWLEDFDPDWTPNTTDRTRRRYRYAHQPAVAHWNLARFGEAIAPLVESVEPLEAGLATYREVIERSLFEHLQRKLGLSGPPDGQGPFPSESGRDPGFGVDLRDSIIDELGHVLRLAEMDMTLFFRRLSEVPADPDWASSKSDAALVGFFDAARYAPEPSSAEAAARFAGWLRRYVRRASREEAPPEERRARMNAVNPKYVLRNYLAQTAIERAEEGDYSRVRELLEVLQRPYDDQPGKDELASKRPEWAKHRAGCSMLSCSS